MKLKNFSFYALGTALLLTAASCSNDIIDDGGNNLDNRPVETHYLNVSIVSAVGQGTRGPGDTYTDGEGEYAAKYEDGTLTENKVSSVRFYFFDSTGKSAKVKKNAGVSELINYYDWTPGNGDQNTSNSDNIESVLNATIVINTAEGDEIPSSIIAVVNPSTTVEEANVGAIRNSTLCDPGEVTLNSVTGNFNSTTEGTFMMSNSVYRNGNDDSNAEVVEEVSVLDHLHTSSEAALSDPVIIYVDRVNAKARATTSLQNGKEVTINAGQANAETFTIYPTTVTTNPVENNAIEEGDVLETEEVYVRLLGWNVTCNTNKSNLMKEIDPTWKSATLFGNALNNWNNSDRYRSFWAINPTLSYIRGTLSEGQSMNYIYGNFEAAQAIPNFSAGTTEKPLVNYTYLQENAGLSGSTPSCQHPTQLIVAAQLVDEDGNEIPLAEWGFNQYTQNGLLTVFAGKSEIYTRTIENLGQDNEKVTITPIDIDNLQFVSAITAGKGNVNNDGRYYAYVMLKPNLTESFYIGKENALNPEAQPANEGDLNAVLLGLGHCKVWTSGYTYYYIDIRHLGNYTPATGENTPAVSYPGTWGIVRNHIYDMNINVLTGLGTPVVDPEETIYPERPKEEDTYIGAQINILNWRVVSQEVGFVW